MGFRNNMNNILDSKQSERTNDFTIFIFSMGKFDPMIKCVSFILKQI